MTDDERALLQAQATILAGLLASDDDRPVDDLIQDAQRIAHILAQNLDQGVGFA